jgi:hypothetical protein
LAGILPLVNATEWMMEKGGLAKMGNKEIGGNKSTLRVGKMSGEREGKGMKQPKEAEASSLQKAN